MYSKFLVKPHRHIKLIEEYNKLVEQGYFDKGWYNVYYKSRGGLWMRCIPSPDFLEQVEYKIVKSKNHPDIYKEQDCFIVVNDYKVPKGISILDRSNLNPISILYIVDFSEKSLYKEVYLFQVDTMLEVLIKNNMLHETQNGAIAQAKAMLRINPECFTEK